MSKDGLTSAGFFQTVTPYVGNKTTLDFFDDSKDISDRISGPEGIPPKIEDWSRPFISKERLADVLLGVTNCIDPRQNQEFGWNKPVVIEQTISSMGERKRYNVCLELMYLRQKPNSYKTSQERLLQRALSLVSYDSLNPVSVGSQVMGDIYNDLNLLDKNIMPKLNPVSMISSSGKDMDKVVRDNKAANQVPDGFFAFRMYQDSERRIKLHLYQPKGVEAAVDNRPHEHDGVSGSIVLAGELENRFVEPVEEGDTKWSIFIAERNPESRKDLSKLANKLGDTSFQSINNHPYKTGDHYFLNAAVRQIGLAHLDNQLDPWEKNYSYHVIASKPRSATLFTQQFSMDPRIKTTFPLKTPTPVEEKKYGEGIVVEPLTLDQTYDVLVDMDKIIRAELESVGINKKPNTVISRQAKSSGLKGKSKSEMYSQMKSTLWSRIYDPLEPVAIDKNQSLTMNSIK